MRTQQPKTVYYPVPIEELESKKRRRSHYGAGQGGNPDSRVFCMIETDAFFETNLSVIQKEYIGTARNTAGVGQLLYEFFVFFPYEFEPAS